MGNHKKVLGDLELVVEVYNVIPYMVTNKLFVSRYKEVMFNIISYNEFCKLIK